MSQIYKMGHCPKDVLSLICSKMNCQGLINFAKTSKYHDVTVSRDEWQHLIIRLESIKDIIIFVT